jgi:SAM-dependent methyltransferase
MRGGWPDEARLIIQRSVFQHLLHGCELRGACLNAGSGEGLFVPFLDSFRELTRIVHMDLKKPVLAHLKLDLRHEIAEGSLVDLPFKDGQFDFVLCTEVLEHVSDDTRAFREIGRVLRPGGLALLSAPTPPAPYDPAHVRVGYTLNEFRKRLAGARVELLKHAYCFRGAMRLLLKIWRWQYELTGQRKSWMPKAAILTLAYCDRWIPIGKPFDIVVLGRKMSI